MGEAAARNASAAIAARRATGALTWRSLVVMLFARAAFAVAAQGIVALVYATRGSATPWRDAEAWLPVYGTLIDAGCLCMLWWLTRREGITLADLVGFDRRRVLRDVLLGLALIPPGLVLIFGGVAISGFLMHGGVDLPQYGQPLPLIPALYALLVWPLIWGLTEQMTYNGYLLPRFQVLSGSTALAVAVVALVWAFQHAFMPLTFDLDYMIHRFVSSVPNALFMVLVYLRLRRLLPLVVAHWLMDGASVFAGSILPLLA
ncbi:CPBP family intramembrane metalloprotease [Luteimonas sp. BDR2-5]|uniref:CPBP family glutamic-type intramembrane protease n=1 Tax=Proluteimonas luteida TaxID=2878685 RepID=UPI001E4898CC|nr:CPBP family glutamic-type intramembrane protease [Luteimonas sp. BDR2-5]MCD9027896.1 CPBP family intramembrane metalloprotease [Luteimonas sp. BDR2-5]